MPTVSDYCIPPWCQMSTLEHETLGGCWGISSGQQPQRGEKYCRLCEYYAKQDCENWSTKWNALPFPIRHIGAMVETKMRIQQLGFERERLTKRYRQSLREVDQHIANLKDSLRKAEPERDDAQDCEKTKDIES